jgi:acetolactate synthase-1/2/3 large subunit
MKKVNDYILDFLVSQGVKHVFLITGGAIAFVVDAFHGRKDIKYVCVAHEQAGAMMAESYSRLGPGFSAAMVTSGPGATNLITGICCAWFDSIPALYISGQVNTYEQKGKTKVRQVGFQETDIVSIVRPITKYAVQLDKAENIRYELEKATYIAKSGRPGPVLIDIPMNFQRAEINLKKLKKFTPPTKKEYKDAGNNLINKINRIILEIQKAKRPVFLVGGGIRLANAQSEAYELANITGFPVVSSWSGYDLFDRNYPRYIGAHGVYGERAANFTIQNADFIISIGSRLDTRQTGGNPATFAREAKLVMVDIDQAELDKRRGFTPWLSVNCDAKEFLHTLIKKIKRLNKKPFASWVALSKEWKKKYPVVSQSFFKEKNYVNPYVFIKVLSEELDKKAIIIPDDGANLTWTIQAFEIKKGQRLFSAFGNSPMGYAFPAAIGASIALNKREIICIDGDGSLQINIQELQTLSHLKLPVKVFIFNNQGYGIIKQFQSLYLGSRFEASGKGVTLPDFIKVARAYGIHTESIKNHSNIRSKIRKVLRQKGPVICDISIKPLQKIIPKLEFGNPIEDLSPLLPRKEFNKNMIIKSFKSHKEADRSKANEIN